MRSRPLISKSVNLREGFKIIMTIHDEIVAEVPSDSPLGIDKLLECMNDVRGGPMAWDLPLRLKATRVRITRNRRLYDC